MSKLVKYELVESVFNYVPTPLKITTGWGNGYVLVPESHPLYGLYEDELYEVFPELEVHGGITFAELAYNEEYNILNGDTSPYWVFGFDTAHYDDTPENWTKEDVHNETISLYEQIVDFQDNITPEKLKHIQTIKL